MKRALLSVIAIALLAGCATGYRKTGGTWVGGYDDAKITDTQYRVSYQGYGDQSPAQVYQWFLLRGAELAKGNGYQYFKVQDGQAGAMNRGNMFAQVNMANYSGTVILLKDKEPNAFEAEELIKNTPRK